jgi:hypothetical protein
MNTVKLIPYSHLQSWMHARIPLPNETADDRLVKYLSQSKQDKQIDSIMSQLLAKTGLLSKERRWIFYRGACRMAYFLFKALNRLEVHGRKNIPKNGAIFYVNHTSAIDPAILMGALRIPIGFFLDSGYGWMADTLERIFGFVSHQGSGDEVIERFIRTIYGLNPFFAIWPEGYYEKDEVVSGFSGFVKAYAVLNSEKNRIPLVPVVIQGGQCYGDEMLNQGFRLRKIRVDILKPVFLPRTWLYQPAQGGKTPRQLADYLMLRLARSLGQERLGKNWYLEAHRR